MIQKAGKHARLDALLKQRLSETHAALDPPTHLHRSTQTKLILISRFALLTVILKCIFATTECDSQKHILIP